MILYALEPWRQDIEKSQLSAWRHLPPEQTAVDVPAYRPQCVDVFLSDERQPVAGRVCAIRKTRAAIELAHRRIKHKARDESRSVNPETLEYAKFVTVFSTFPENEFSVKEILEWYRLRWQIELVFKRFKQIAALGHLPKYDDQSSRAWLYGKLLVALLTEKLVQHANSFSPWGYELPPTTKAQLMA